jgi:hypothetical protein
MFGKTTSYTMMMMMMMMIQFCIYLRSELKSQWPITESARIQTTAMKQHRAKQTNETTKQRKMD